MRKVSERHRQWLMKELPVLENHGVLSSTQAGDIRSYYETSTRSGMHWAVIAFSVLGSLLIGSGVILLFAHNWDELTRPMRAALSFCPLATGIILSMTALLRNGGVALRESAGIFHSLAVGATISLIGQTYHLPSNAPGFMLTWSLLIMPLIFLLRSTGVCLIYLALICSWSGIAQQTYGHAAGFWLLALPPVVRLLQVARKNLYSAETSLAFAGLIIALCVSLGIALEHTVPGLWIVTYSALLSGTALLGIHLYGGREGWNNIPKTLGTIGIVIITYILTWEELWDDIGWSHVHTGWRYQSWGAWLDSGITLICIAGWIFATVKAFRRDSIETITLGLFPVIAGSCFLIGSLARHTDLLNAVIFNAFMLYLGLMYIVQGCRNNKLRQLNGGMAVLALLLVTRFFDSGIGYLARGIVFILLGIVFLSVNLVMLRRNRRKEVVA